MGKMFFEPDIGAEHWQMKITVFVLLQKRIKDGKIDGFKIQAKHFTV
ncbi:hypothetical protein [Pedobacter rhodius]|uniref:Uncharacterized protein n=1 Tax=Pedobacter rhodius TaxID=3004098 RepID=A0ABT4L1L5_9SPHI|nr:hypothetical protein [Pedobacter sp. SJ11]MCZ4224836.1 hypothetical protein [Pedobacter sp. SJ11]